MASFWLLGVRFLPVLLLLLLLCILVLLCCWLLSVACIGCVSFILVVSGVHGGVDDGVVLATDVDGWGDWGVAVAAGNRLNFSLCCGIATVAVVIQYMGMPFWFAPFCLWWRGWSEED